MDTLQESETQENKTAPGPATDQAQGAATPEIKNAAGLKSNPATRYTDPKIVKQQSREAWTLSLAILAAVGLTFLLFFLSSAWWSCVILAGLGGIAGGLLHSLKWFYRTVANGEWTWDKLWWRFMNPLVSGVVGFSIYIVISAFDKSPQPTAGKETFVAYSIGFLSGLFADNAMNKLRDVAYVLFGQTQPSASKPKQPQQPPKGNAPGGTTA